MSRRILFQKTPLAKWKTSMVVTLPWAEELLLMSIENIMTILSLVTGFTKSLKLNAKAQHPEYETWKTGAHMVK